MRTHEHLVLCGGLEAPRRAKEQCLSLSLRGKTANVRLQITDIARRLVMNIPEALVDLLEVTSYVYAADSAIPRGGIAHGGMGSRWRRKFRFVIPVRLPELWSSGLVSNALSETLSFLSEDDYEFEFALLENPPALERYFEFPNSESSGFTPDEVILFSGGLDSFAGTIEALARGEKVALVSHRSASKIAGAQKRLVDQLRDSFGTDRVLHVPVWANVDGSLTREWTHRTRSFLFAALGAVTARLFERNRICFFENGVVSLNLPAVAQVIGARATRSTHPQALAGFRRVLSSLFEHPFAVDNPFMWMTKSEVVERISANACSGLIRDTRSCTRVHDMTKLHPHCGQCSQCIDRRFAVLAAGQESEDPWEGYKVDLFTGGRPGGPDREMALAYVRAASEINEMEDVAFFAHYGESSRIVGFFPDSTDTIAGRILDLYRRHASAVCNVLEQAISLHAGDLRQGKLPPDCLLSLIVSQRHVESIYPERRREIERDVTIGSEVRMAIDEDRGRVRFERWGEIKGVSAELIIALAESFRQAARDELAPHNYPFTKTAQLMRQLGCNSDETLRRRVKRCRDKIVNLATIAGDAPPSLDAVIEKIQWHGYRLNPDRIRIVALSEVSGSE